MTTEYSFGRGDMIELSDEGVEALGESGSDRAHTDDTSCECDGCYARRERNV